MLIANSAIKHKIKKAIAAGGIINAKITETTSGIARRQPLNKTKLFTFKRKSCVSEVKPLYTAKVSMNATNSCGVAPQINNVGTITKDKATPVKRETIAAQKPAVK